MGWPLEVLAAIGMAAATSAVHLLGLTLLLLLAGVHLTRWRTPWLTVDRILAPLGIVTGLFLVHLAEVVLYAVLFTHVGAADSIEEALYLSVGAYTTAGWAGATIPEHWRLLAAFEALNGILLIGWSTAFLFQTLNHILAGEGHHPLPDGVLAKDSPRPRRSGKGAPSGTNSKDTELMQ